MAEPTNPGEPIPPGGANPADGSQASAPGGGGFIKQVSWPLAVIVVAGCGLMAVVVQQCSPGAQAQKLADASNGLAKGMQKLAAAINDHHITESFISHLDALRPDMKNRMLVAEGKSTESFSAKDESWHGTATADLRVPVTYHYFVALTEPWELNVQVTPAGVVGEVIAPALHSLNPSVETSQLEMQNANGWANFNGPELAGGLLQDLTLKLNQRAQQQMGLYFPTARDAVEKFVRTWMLQQYDLSPDTKIFLHVKFRNEPGAVPATSVGTARLDQPKG